MKTRKHCIVMAIAIIAFAVIGCNQDASPQSAATPVPQSKNITVGTNKTVTVNFTALPDTTPAWWSNLESALKNLGTSFFVGNYTLNVTSGTGGFVKTGSKTATVSETWLSQSDYETLRVSINAMLEDWIE
jgi:hypothetical protein